MILNLIPLYSKSIYVSVDILSIAVIVLVVRALDRQPAAYRHWLKKAMISATVAIIANILIAVSQGPLFAELSYCMYFTSIDWIIYYLVAFCLSYTEHDPIIKRIGIPAAVIMIADNIAIFTNFFLKLHFHIYMTTNSAGVAFYQTAIHPLYYVHLVIDYFAILVALTFVLRKIGTTHSFYRMKYVLILSVILLVIILNLLYMTFSLVLDASVIFYAVAGVMILFCTDVFVPRSLMIVSTESAVDNMNEGLILFDLSGNCIYANAFAKDRFDIDEATFDQTCEPVSVIGSIDLSNDNTPRKEADYERRIETDTEGGPQTQHYRIKFDRLIDSRSHTIGAYYLIEDTTEEVFYLNEIEEARDNADSANRAKSSFLANMSHEIRTPLNTVIGMNEMILRTTDDPKLTEYAQSIKLSGETLLGLINDILDFSKIEANKMDIINTEYNPHKLLRDSYYYFAKMAHDKDLTLDIISDEDIPSLLYGDNRHIMQVLTNIISNAIKYTKEGGVKIRMSVSAAEEASHSGAETEDPDRSKSPELHKPIMLDFEVADTGIGISEEDQKYLFDAFRRVNEVQNATIQGTGLGLSIARELVHLMHGEITVESSEGQGSKFRFRIPQEVRNAAPLGPFNADLKTEEKTYKESFRAPDADVLIVDDSALNLKVAAALLTKTLIRVDKASSGDEAIAMCNDKKYDLILLDHRMPVKDGIETFHELQKAGMNTDTPVVMLTANAISGAEEEYLKEGFAGYLTKPIKSEQIEKELIRLLPPWKVQIT